MQVDDIRAFVPSKNYQQSQAFYRAFGFELTTISDTLCLCESGECGFFLQDFYQPQLANNLMLQLSVLDIDEVYSQLHRLNDFNVKHSDITQQPWGKELNLWGPAGELWQIIEFFD